MEPEKAIELNKQPGTNPLEQRRLKPLGLKGTPPKKHRDLCRVQLPMLTHTHALPPQGQGGQGAVVGQSARKAAPVPHREDVGVGAADGHLGPLHPVVLEGVLRRLHASAKTSPPQKKISLRSINMALCTGSQVPPLQDHLREGREFHGGTGNPEPGSWRLCLGRLQGKSKRNHLLEGSPPSKKEQTAHHMAKPKGQRFSRGRKKNVSKTSRAKDLVAKPLGTLKINMEHPLSEPD